MRNHQELLRDHAASLSAATATRDVAVTRANEVAEAAKQAHRDLEAAATRALLEQIEERAKDLQARFFKILAPLAADFVEEPSNKLAGQIAEKFRDLDSEALAMVGEALESSSIAQLFAHHAVAANHDRIEIFARPDALHCVPGSCGTASHVAVVVLRDPASSPLSAKRALEDAALAVSSYSYKPCVAPDAAALLRWTIITRGGTRGAKLAALEELKARVAREVTERSARESSEQQAREQAKFTSENPGRKFLPNFRLV